MERQDTITPMAEERGGPLADALARVGDRWTLQIVEALLGGPRRFGELEQAIPGIASNVLSARLKSLERDGILSARPYSERPMRLEYELTAEGRDLAGALRMLAQWGAQHAGGELPRHAACGTPMDARWYCPTCARAVDDRETTEIRVI